MVEEQYFATNCQGTGGRIKKRIEDFIVEEFSFDNEKCIVELPMPENTKMPVPENTENKEYLIVELQKYNCDLNFAVKKLSTFMRFSRKRIGFAGLKDKRGVTSQKICLWNPSPEKMREFQSRQLWLKKPVWSDKKIEIGNLIGNQFTIIIREIKLEKEETQKIIEKLLLEIQEKGIINYFGEQRFGGIRRVSHLVGKQFVKGNLKQGVIDYLTLANDLEEESIRIARKNLGETMDFKTALKEFPQKYRFERAILNRLVKNPSDFANAFRALPKSLCYLFTHAYQSYLFNKLINMRIEKGIGLKETKEDFLEEGIPTMQLLGFNSEFSSGAIGEIEKELLEKEEIKLADFKIKQMPELSSKGNRKKIVLFPKDMKFHGIEEDETMESARKAKISFCLEKGNYATTVLREIMKTGEKINE